MDIRGKIKNTLWQIKGQQYYCEELVKVLNSNERVYQTVIVFSTIVGIILLFVIPEGGWKYFTLVVTILAQVSTIGYPYIMNYSSDITQLKQYIILLKSLSNSIYIELVYEECNDQDVKRFEAEYQRIDELVDIRDIREKKRKKLIKIAQEKTEIWMKEKVERINV